MQTRTTTTHAYADMMHYSNENTSPQQQDQALWHTKKSPAMEDSWVTLQDPTTGHYYYHNKSTGQSHWCHQSPPANEIQAAPVDHPNQQPQPAVAAGGPKRVVLGDLQHGGAREAGGREAGGREAPAPTAGAAPTGPVRNLNGEVQAVAAGIPQAEVMTAQDPAGQAPAASPAEELGARTNSTAAEEAFAKLARSKHERPEAPTEEPPPKVFAREKQTEGFKVSRAMRLTPNLSKMLPEPIIDFFKDVAEIKSCNPHYFVPLLLPFLFSAMPKIRIAAYKLSGGRFAKALTFSVAANASGVLLSETGGNKSGMLDFFIDANNLYMSMGSSHHDITDFTMEALCSAMCDNGGRALVVQQEIKKLCYVDQYKKSGGDGTERLMEFQDGSTGRVARKGVAADDDDGDEDPHEEKPKKKKKKSVHMETVTPHLNVAGNTHPQCGHAMVFAEEKDPIGKTARFSMAVLHAIPYNLPAPARVAELMDKLERLPKLHIVMGIMTLFCNLAFEQRATDASKDKYAFIYCDADAYARLQVYASKVKGLMEAVQGACMSGVNSSLQVSAYSKSKGNALKFSGVLYLFTLAWDLCAAHEELIDFEGTLSELAELELARLDGDTLQDHLEDVLEKNEERGGDIHGQAMEYAIELSEYFMGQMLALQNQVYEVDGGDGTGAATSPGAPLQRQSPVHIVSNEQEEKKEAKRNPKKDYESLVVWTAAQLVLALKSENFVVSASWLTKGDKGKIAIGERSSGAKATFIDAARYLQARSLGSLVTEGTQAKPKLFFKFVDFAPVVTLASTTDKSSILFDIGQKLAPLKVNYEQYTTCMKELIPFDKWAWPKLDPQLCMPRAVIAARKKQEAGPSSAPLDATEPRLEPELNAADNLRSVYRTEAEAALAASAEAELADFVGY